MSGGNGNNGLEEGTTVFVCTGNTFHEVTWTQKLQTRMMDSHILKQRIRVLKNTDWSKLQPEQVLKAYKAVIDV